jgi:Glycosyltransferase family 87
MSADASAPASREPGFGAASGRPAPRLLGVFAAERLVAYGTALAVSYAAIFLLWYWNGVWLVDRIGRPLPYNDFVYWWTGGSQVLHGAAGSVYDPAQLGKLLETLLGADHVHELAEQVYYRNWPYPPVFLLILTPLALLPYLPAFLLWEATTTLAYVAMVFRIVRHRAAIPLALASPFAALDIRWAQTGLFRTALFGAALLALERRPVLAGIFIGCTAYKPQFGILIPVALAAGRRWRAFASAAVTIGVLVCVSVLAFGTGPWSALPQQIHNQAAEILLLPYAREVDLAWIQTVYGLVRTLHGGPRVAWLAQACAAAGAAIVVWIVWRSSARCALKAALLSAATLIATPYGWPYDFVAIAIPIAFLVREQIDCGLLRGEQTILLALFVGAVTIILWSGDLPLGPVIVIALMGLILRRVAAAARTGSRLAAISCRLSAPG